MYSEETCAEAIKSFQERLVEVDTLKKDKNVKYLEICWQTMRQEGPAVLNVAKYLMTYFQETNAWYNENKSIIDRALLQHGAKQAEREEREYEREMRAERG
jgi:hypothetical protein